MRAPSLWWLIPGLLYVGLLLPACSDGDSFLCLQDAECPQACRNGRCVEFPRPEAAASCQVVPDFVLGRPGTRVRFDVEVRDAAGEHLVLGEGITWAAATEEVTGGGTGRSATFTLAKPGEAPAVEARVANATCQAHVTVLSGEVAPGRVRVVVTDELTGRPLPGAVVAATSAEGSITSSSATDARGVAWVSATGEVSLTVFHGDYGYLTLAHYGTEKGTRDVSLPLRRTPLELHGGVRGTFVNVPQSKNLLLGLTGLSMPALGLDVNERQSAAPSNTHTLPLLGKKYAVSVPAGAYLSLSSTVIQEEYTSPGVGGVCDTRLAGIFNPEVAIRASACGTRIGWALAGELPLTELKLEPSAGGFDPELSFAQVVAQRPTLLQRFHSSVVREVQFQLRPTSWDENDRPLFHDREHYTPQVNHDFQQLPLGLQFNVNVPKPPQYNSASLTTVSVQAGVDVAGRGMVPLGLGFASTQGDSVLAHVYMAPAHHGLESSPYRLLVLASSKTTLGPRANGTVTSVVIEPPRGVPFDPRRDKAVRLSRSFLPIPREARYNFSAVANPRLQGREFRFLSSPEPSDATLLRVHFTNGRGHRWTVLLAPKHAARGLRLPVPPAPFEDRTYSGDKNGSRAELLVQLLAVRDEGGGELDPVALAEARDVSLARLMEFTEALSQLNYDRPRVEWATPPPEVNSVPRGALVSVQVTDFHVNSGPLEEGFVLLSFEGGTGCEGKTDRGRVNNSMDEGEVFLRLPSDCSGTRVKMTATLVDSSNVALSPLVSNFRIVDID